MILKDTDAGKELQLWCGDSAKKISEWEEKGSALLNEFGYQRVFTPYIVKKDNCILLQHLLRRSRINTYVIIG
jgi:hypothetical protein